MMTWSLERYIVLQLTDLNWCRINDRLQSRVWQLEMDCRMALEKKTFSVRKQDRILQEFPGEQRKNGVWEKGGKMDWGGYSLTMERWS